MIKWDDVNWDDPDFSDTTVALGYLDHDTLAFRITKGEAQSVRFLPPVKVYWLYDYEDGRKKLYRQTKHTLEQVKVHAENICTARRYYA